MARSRKIDLSSEAEAFTFADLAGMPQPESTSAPSPEPLKTEGPSSVSLSAPIRLSVRRKGYGGKTVTLVTGIGGSPEALAEFVKSVKKGLGCGASLGEEGIVVQGDQRERLIAFLKAKGARNVK